VKKIKSNKEWGKYQILEEKWLREKKSIDREIL